MQTMRMMFYDYTIYIRTCQTFARRKRRIMAKIFTSPRLRTCTFRQKKKAARAAERDDSKRGNRKEATERKATPYPPYPTLSEDPPPFADALHRKARLGDAGGERFVRQGALDEHEPALEIRLRARHAVEEQ